MNKSILLLLALSLAGAPLSGCTTVNQFDKSQLDQLDGYRYREKSMGQEIMEGVGARASTDPRLFDEDGDTYKFDGEEALVLLLNGQNAGGELREVEHRYLRIDVTEELFRGQIRGSNQSVEFPRADIEASGVRQFSWGRTALLSASIAAGLVAGLVIVALNTDSDGSGGGGFGDDDD